MIWIKNAGNWFNTSDEIRECGRESGFIDSDDDSAGIVYMRGWVGFALNDNLPDEAIENALSDVLTDKSGILDPTFGFEVDADHPDYDNKAEELQAYYDRTHPDLSDT